MTCHNCRSECRKFGKRKDRQRYQCQQCRKVFTDARDNTLDGMYTSVEAATKALEMLLEGCAVSSVERLTGIHHTTLLKLLVLAGEKAERLMAQFRHRRAQFHNQLLRRLHRRVRPRDELDLRQGLAGDVVFLDELLFGYDG